MFHLVVTILIHIFITTTVFAYSQTETYQPPKTRAEQLFMSSRSHVDRERSTRRVFHENPIRFGGRSDIPPLVGKAMEYESMLEDEMNRDRRAFSKNSHLRFGRANSNFMRFGRKNDYNNRFGRGNNNFLRFGRGSSDFIRFGRSDGYLRHKRDTIDDTDEKRSNNNFMRFGKRFEQDDYLENSREDDNINTETLDSRDSLLMKLVTQMICKLDDIKCERVN